MWNTLKAKFNALPWYIKNIYALTLIVFIIWMLFFDRFNAFRKYQINAQLKDLKSKKAYYQKEIEHNIQQKEELFSTDEKMEKFARENYYMKKDNEDIFVIIEE